MNLFSFSGSVGAVHNHLTIAVLKIAPTVPGSQPLVHAAAAPGAASSWLVQHLDCLHAAATVPKPPRPFCLHKPHLGPSC